MFYKMGLCSRPGRDPNAGKHCGPELDRAWEPDIRPLGSEGFWNEDYGVGDPGRPPFWRTLVSPARGWTPVPYK